MLTLTPTGNFQGASTFACTGLPASATCTFAPSVVNFAGNNAAVTTQLTIATNVQTSSLRPLDRRESGTLLAGIFFVPGLFFAGIIAMRRRDFDGRFGGLLMALLVMGGLMATAAAEAVPPHPQQLRLRLLPAQYSVVVTANAVNGIASTTQQLTATVTVTQ